MAAALNTLLLWRGLVKEGVLRPSAGVAEVPAARAGRQRSSWARCCGGWPATRCTGRSMPFIERVLRCGGGIALGAAVYFAVLFALGMR